MKSVGSFLMLYLAFVSIDAVLVKLKHNDPICFSVDIDSHKTIIVQSSVKPQLQCQVQLTIDTNTEYNIQDGKPYKRKRQHFFNCQNLGQNKFYQKFVEEEEQSNSINKLRVCATSRLPQPVVINLSIQDLVSPDFQEIDDEELSLVSSKELVELRHKMQDINQQVGKMEPLGAKYIETEERIYKNYIQQKETLNFVVKVQIALIVMIGIVWVLAFNLIKGQRM